MRVAIVGSGIAGIASAIRLSCQGHGVAVFEASAYPGGKLSEIKLGKYRFDAGPSLFTMPQLVEDLFLLANKNPKEHFEYIQLEKSCNYLYEDGTRFTAFQNRTKFANELAEKLNYKSPNRLFDYLDQAAFRYRLIAPIFLEYSLHRFSNYFNVQTLKGLLFSWRLKLFSSMNDENNKHFEDPRMVQYFNRFATYNGSSPYLAPGLLNMIPHLEHNIGTFFPNKGMIDITQSLYKLAVELGVEFHFNSQVEKIEVINQQTKGVLVNGRLWESDLVISNADIYPTYKKLLPNIKAPEKLLSQEKSSSALIFYWGINHSFPELDLHNILFSANYQEEFDAIFHQKTIYSDPTVYINITSKYKADDAPKDCENWFVMINVPNNTGQNWDKLIVNARESIVLKINRLLHVDIEPLIQTQSILDPRTIESKTSSYAGALYGNASNNRFAAFLRHKNFSSDIRGLYFCGGSVHPGGGIPLCLNSAKIVSRLIQEDYS